MRAALLSFVLAGVLAHGQGFGQRPSVQVQVVVQSSFLAGFRHYEAARLWQSIRVGDALTLVREPDNAHDANAVRVEWRGQMLGYVPRTENPAVARHMDGGAALLARVSRLEPSRAPNRRIEFEILARL